jgi:hypothetical protein
VLEKYINCRIFNLHAAKNAQKISNLIKKLKRELHKIDRGAFEDKDYFWPSSLFGSCFDLGTLFTDLENNPLYETNLMDFSTIPKPQKTVSTKIQEAPLPF